MSRNFEEGTYEFIARLKQFDYVIESIDHIWDVIFPHKASRSTGYHHVRVTKYNDIYYIGHMDGNLSTLEVQVKKGIQAAPSFGSSRHHGNPLSGWDGLIFSALKWLKIVRKDWIKANKQVWLSYPLNRRYGIVCNSLVRESLSDMHRIDRELGKAKTKKFIKLVEQGDARDYHNAVLPSMTANDFFKYCKIAYIAGQRKDDSVDENLSGRQMYERYADGRDEGLLEIAPNSKEEFADWIDGKHPKRTTGGHPWEIKRGGNTTHIDLSVSRPSYGNEGFKVSLRGRAINRLKETICMFLSIHEAGLPIAIDDPEGIRKRLLGQDNVGIVPCFDSLHRANQHFPEHESVYDVMHYDDLGRYKSRIRPFITWEPLPILKPKSNS
jgi:hypothetical protein